MTDRRQRMMIASIGVDGIAPGTPHIQHRRQGLAFDKVNEQVNPAGRNATDSGFIDNRPASRNTTTPIIGPRIGVQLSRKGHRPRSKGSPSQTAMGPSIRAPPARRVDLKSDIKIHSFVSRRLFARTLRRKCTTVLTAAL
jgi:hypothetical protein